VHDPAAAASDLPAFCCAILRDSRGWFVLERRPLSNRSAPGQLTCFGGTREGGEDPEACVRRELREEIGFDAGALTRRVVVRTPKGAAWFYEGAGPEDGAVRALEAGYGVVWVAPERLADAPIARWNRAAIEAMLDGKGAVEVD
jgi:8-oxo-dGTP pyrophosphatase MutT (NUDIX family)